MSRGNVTAVLACLGLGIVAALTGADGRFEIELGDLPVSSVR